MTARGSRPDIVPSDDLVGAALVFALMWPSRRAPHLAPDRGLMAVRKTLASLGWSEPVDDTVVEEWVEVACRCERGPALIRAGAPPATG